MAQTTCGEPGYAQQHHLFIQNALEQAFDTDGHQTAHLPVKIGGDIAALAELLTQCGWQLITTDNPPLYLLLTLINPSISAG